MASTIQYTRLFFLVVYLSVNIFRSLFLHKQSHLFHHCIAEIIYLCTSCCLLLEVMSFLLSYEVSYAHISFYLQLLLLKPALELFKV